MGYLSARDVLLFTFTSATNFCFAWQCHTCGDLRKQLLLFAESTKRQQKQWCEHVAMLIRNELELEFLRRSMTHLCTDLHKLCKLSVRIAEVQDSMISTTCP